MKRPNRDDEQMRVGDKVAYRGCLVVKKLTTGYFIECDGQTISCHQESVDTAKDVIDDLLEM